MEVVTRARDHEYMSSLMKQWFRGSSQAWHGITLSCFLSVLLSLALSLICMSYRRYRHQSEFKLTIFPPHTPASNMHPLLCENFLTLILIVRCVSVVLMLVRRLKHRVIYVESSQYWLESLRYNPHLTNRFNEMFHKFDSHIYYSLGSALIKPKPEVSVSLRMLASLSHSHIMSVFSDTIKCWCIHGSTLGV